MLSDKHAWSAGLPTPGSPDGLPRGGRPMVVARSAVAWSPRRGRGRAPASMLVVGTADDVAWLVALTGRDRSPRWRVVGACTSTGTGPDDTDHVAGVPVLGDLDAVAHAALVRGIDAVAVCPTPGWSAVRLQQLARDLDLGPTALLVDPRLRPHTSPAVAADEVRGLPLLRLTNPVLAGPRRLAKTALDRSAAAALLLVLAPVLLSCAVAVRRDGGPALARQIRVGRHGRSFAMLEFRTTAVGGAATSPVGRVLRARGLDVLPQLVNVLRGSMALVGPRPLTPAESTHLGAPHLTVKPGLTGLWPTGRGRVLTVDEAEVLERRYAQDWSPVLDARILLQSLRVALSDSGR